MPYCPQCNTAFPEGAEICGACGAELVPGQPPTPSPEIGSEELIHLRQFSGPTATMEGDMARNVLQAEGIPCFLAGETSGEILPGIGSLSLMVRRQDAAQAAEILESYLNAPAEMAQDGEEEDDPTDAQP